MDKRETSHLVFFFFLLACSNHVHVNGQCAFPCKYQGKKFVDARTRVVTLFSCDDKTRQTVISRRRYRYRLRSVRECVTRSGPFTVIRKKGTSYYRCAKDVFNAHNTTFAYYTPWRSFNDKLPSVCDTCYGFGREPSLLNAAHELVYWRTHPPPIGCNRPRGCTKKHTGDISCAGCEQKEDEGLCCGTCHERKYYKY